VTVGTERLAIDGGPPVRPTMLPYGHQVISDDDVAAVVAALRSDWLTTGPLVARFEREFAAFVRALHAAAVSNGTAALHAAAFAAADGPGDEVIVPALTFVASANCMRYLGGTVVLADVRSNTLTIDSRDVERRVRRRTKAIVPVDTKEFWGRAYAREAWSLLIDWAYRWAYRDLEPRKIVAGACEPKVAGIAVLRALGFRVEGTLRGECLVGGQQVDALRFGLFDDEFVPLRARAMAARSVG
jgi:RimJ/RimL family protein N-acetyltransferase